MTGYAYPSRYITTVRGGLATRAYQYTGAGGTYVIAIGLGLGGGSAVGGGV
jgi:hypothetical protein